MILNREYEVVNMYFKKWEELKVFHPIEKGIWNKEILCEYLVWSCHRDFKKSIDDFFIKYQQNERLAELLFDILLNDDLDGSDCQMGAAYYIARLDKELLKKKKELLLQTQKNEVEWKRPFQEMNI